MADDEKKLTDQFNILFDDITDDLGDEAKELEARTEEAVKDTAEDVKEAVSEKAEDAGAFTEEASDDTESIFKDVEKALADTEEKTTELGASAVKKAEEAEDAFEEATEPKNRRAFVREDPKSLLDELNMEDEDRYESDEADEYERDEEPRKRPVKKPPYEDGGQKKGMSSENLRFWIFTAIVALLVIAAVLFILWKRGIIFHGGDDVTTAAPTIQTTEPTKPTETIAPETTTAVPETTTEPEPTTTEVPEEVREVLDHYQKLFVVRDKVGDQEVNLLNIRGQASTDARVIARIARYGGGEVLEEGEEWVKISSGGYTGYVKKEFIAMGEEAEQIALEHADKHVRATAENGLRIRSMPSTNGEVLATVPNGAIMLYEGEEDGFYHIVYADRFDGYVSADHSVYEYLLMGAIPPEE